MRLEYLSLSHLRQEALDFGLEFLQFGVDLGERPGWRVDVEVAGEGDLVADLGLVVVDPSIRDMWQDLAASCTRRCPRRAARSRCRAGPGLASGLPLGRSAARLRGRSPRRRPTAFSTGAAACRARPAASARRPRTPPFVTDGASTDQRPQRLQQLLPCLVLRQWLRDLRAPRTCPR